MRKKIENLATVALWILWLGGSYIALQTLVDGSVGTRRILSQLTRVAWTPVIGVTIFVTMMVALAIFRRLLPLKEEKRKMISQHDVRWNLQDYERASQGKILDMHFQNEGLASYVESRMEPALILHCEAKNVVNLNGDVQGRTLEYPILAQPMLKTQNS